MVEYVLNGVVEESPIEEIINHVVMCTKGSWHDYSIPVGQQDNMLAMLTLLHKP